MYYGTRNIVVFLKLQKTDVKRQIAQLKSKRDMNWGNGWRWNEIGGEVFKYEYKV